MTTPAQVFDYDMETRDAHPAQDAGGAERPRSAPTTSRGACWRRRPTARLVPVSLLYRKDTPLDGSAPLFLYGYGAYGIAIPASFSTTRLSLVDRGFVFAIAHIRGGKDKGYRWYTDGKLEKKLNTFTDFIAAGEHLVSAGLHPPRPHRRQRRLGRRHADGRGRQHGARAVPRHHRRRAVRRRAQHHARRDAAADAAGVARVGQPDRLARRTSTPSAPTRPTTTWRRRPIRTSSPMAA